MKETHTRRLVRHFSRKAVADGLTDLHLNVLTRLIDTHRQTHTQTHTQHAVGVFINSVMA